MQQLLREEEALQRMKEAKVSSAEHRSGICVRLHASENVGGEASHAVLQQLTHARRACMPAHDCQQT